jgi:hypothetical protein
MKKVFKLFIIIMAFIVLTPGVYAATATVRLPATRTSVVTGNIATVSVVIDASSRIRGGQFNLALSNSNFEIVSVKGANGLTVSSNGNFHIAYKIEADYSIASGSAIATITLRAKSTTVGATSVVTVSNVGVTLEGSYETVSAPNRSITMVIAAPAEPVEPVEPVTPKSSNNDLKALTSTTVSIPFEKNTLTYLLNVANEVTAIELTATPDDPKSTVEITGNTDLETGSNTVLVKVTAENGVVKTYTLTVNRAKSNSNKLTTLTIEGYELIPTFDPDTDRYEINIKDTTVTSLNIDFTLQNPGSKVDIIGNEELMEGKNVIKLIVTAENGEMNTYNIIVNMGQTTEQTAQSIDPLFIFIGISIALALYILIQTIIISKKKK